MNTLSNSYYDRDISKKTDKKKPKEKKEIEKTAVRPVSYHPSARRSKGIFLHVRLLRSASLYVASMAVFSPLFSFARALIPTLFIRLVFSLTLSLSLANSFVCRARSQRSLGSITDYSRPPVSERGPSRHYQEADACLATGRREASVGKECSTHADTRRRSHSRKGRGDHGDGGLHCDGCL